jgi:serpin B
MRSFIYLALFVAGCTPPTSPTTAPQVKPSAPRPAWSPEMQTIAEGNNAFAFDLYAQLRTEPGNLFFSPFSIHTALAMTADGARGETLDEMVKVLHLPKDATARIAAGDVSKFYAAGGDGYELAVANNLWGQRGFPWKADFLDRQRTHFGAELTQMDFVDDANREAARQTINASIEKATKDRIKDLLKKDPPDLTDDTRLVLTNAIYFKGDWAEKFDAKHTEGATFTMSNGSKKAVMMMNRTADIRYMETDSLQAVELPYKNGKLSMVTLLPRKHDGLPALEKELTAANLDGWIKQMYRAKVHLSLPKFRSESRFQLSDSLIKMGMPKAFGVDADFSGMHDDASLCIAKVIHQSFVEVNEESTEAAAATAVVVMVAETAEIPQTPKEFRADHPFVYLIRDTKTGNILFLGRYTGP